MQPYKAWIVTDTIDKNKRVFKIPVYQRNYDWKQENATNSESKLMNATVTVTISARGVQAAHVTDAVDQLKLLFA